MLVELSTWQPSCTCVWCEKERECVETTFSDGFLEKANLCWKCLQTSYKVRSRQQEPSSNASDSP
ncbi:hypothetical protein [Calycomorphotria hydatis]|uniref:Uncharacterized protein n=1 Tax=Calycomorphotria hydatis TaxID=2528027 RepID=A0A517T6S4_9PLAN|nr:hypothetical protein [Calycomorphotria hydatis]QDT64068.1 hypothetical protein V22_12990 [Calycomorphotria hydatis]